MSCSKRSILFHKLFHGSAISHSFLTFRYFWQKNCIRSSRFIIFTLLHNLFFLFGNKYIFNQISILFPLIQHAFLLHFLQLLLFSLLLLSFLNLLQPHIFLIVWYTPTHSIYSLLLYRSFLLLHLNISSLMLFDLSKIDIIFLLEYLLLLLDLPCL